MPIAPPSERNWWDLPLGIHEKVWLILVVAVGLGLFIMMPLWHVFGRQNPSSNTYRISPESYATKVTDWSKGARQVAEGLAPPGQDVYLLAGRFTWFPNALVLQSGVPYRIHLSTKDVNHGFSIHRDGEAAQKANFQVVPGYEYILTMEFTNPGVYHIVCQEYCGIGHQFMVAKFVVTERG